MIAWFILGISLFVGLVLLLRWSAGADPRLLAKIVRGVAIVVGGVVVLYLAVTGRLAVASILFGGLLPLLMRWRSLGRMWRNASGPAPGQQSEVATRLLRMTLDHDTGAMTGTVLDGPFRGRNLDELAPGELGEMLRQFRVEDPQSAALLEAWMDRARAGWRAEDDPAGQATAPPGGSMTRAEAYRILGLEPGASAKEIKAAHRALMQKLHPDRGGSTWLAAKINEAKDLLLRT